MVVGLALFVAGVGSAPPASGQTTTTTASVGPPGMLPVDPGPNGYYEFTLGPGGHTDFSAIVKNVGDTAATYQIYAAEATTGTSGGVAYSGRKATPGMTAAWLRVPAAGVHLEPGGKQQLGFSINVPSDASPGDHITAIAAESPQGSVSQASTGSGPSVQLTTTGRVVVAVVVHVPGPTHAGLTLGQPVVREENGGRQILDIPFNDSGDILLKPHLTGSLSKCSGGQTAVKIDRQLDTFVPHTTVTFSYPLAPTYLPEGCYAVDLSTSYSGGSLGSLRGKLTVTPQGAGTVTTLNGGQGDLGRFGPATPKSSTGNSPLLLAGIGLVIALLVAVVTLLAMLVRRRRPAER